MLNEPIPPHIDPRKLVDRGTTLEGVYAPAGMPRVCEQLTNDADEVHVKVFLERSHQKLVIMHMQLDIEVSIVHQCCLDAVAIPVHGEYTYAILREGQPADGLPKGYDALEVGEESLGLPALVKNELLFASFIVPTYDPEVCQHPAGFVVGDRPESSEIENKRPSPFNVLAQLEHDPDVQELISHGCSAEQKISFRSRHVSFP